MTLRPEAVADLFDLPPPEAEAETDESAAQAMEAAEAALAAEFAAEVDAGVVATDAPDSRRNSRVPVSWSACVRLADGQVIDLKVRNISASGVGLTSRQHVPADAVVDFEMCVPALVDGGEASAVKGTLRTTYATPLGAESLFGGSWVQVPADHLELVNRWIKRLQG
jgi:hypothetical protein